MSLLEERIGQRLRSLRQRRGLSMGALAQRAGIQVSTLSRWESGQRQPILSTLEPVLTTLTVTESERREILRLLHAPRAIHRLRSLDAAAASPAGGDLLLALRQRKGWTQAQTARAVGVAQSQIARWEKNESWPTTDKLHTLCWHLSAGEDEVAALTAGGEHLHLSERDTDLAAPDMAEEEWAGYIARQLTAPAPLSLLTVFRLQQQLSDLAQKQAFAARLLPNTYAILARHHLHHAEFGQAAQASARGMALSRAHRRQGETKGSLSSDTALWFGNVLVAADCAAQGEKPAGLRRAARLLSEWLPAVETDPAHQAWGRSKLARYTAQLGYPSEAIALGRDAYRQATTASNYEYFFRLRDQAYLLKKVGRHAEALKLLDRGRFLETESNDNFLRHRLMEAECFLALSDRASAGERLHSATQRLRTDSGVDMIEGLRDLEADL